MNSSFSVASSLILVLICTYIFVFPLNSDLYDRIFGLNPVNGSGELLQFFVVIIRTFSGIVLSIVVTQLRSRTGEPAIDKVSVLTASAVAPVIIGTIYPNVAALPSTFLVFLLCYQNGFFWEAVLKRQKG